MIFPIGKSSSLKEANKILSSKDEEYLNSANALNNFINGHDNADRERMSFQALKKLKLYKGNFSSFTEEEKHLLLSLRQGVRELDGILRNLIENNTNPAVIEQAGKYEQLIKKMPSQYNSGSQVIQFLIEIVKDYQWQLEHFVMKFHGQINKALGVDEEEDEVFVLPE